MVMDQEAQRSELKKLIIRGKEQGYLTYREINDSLPEEVHDTDQIEAVVNMINDMGIEVFDQPPDPDSLLLKTESSTAEGESVDAAEEAEQVVARAVESEFGRTTDPVRMYMREMGTVELLTREGEIILAKRIEDGIRQSVMAIASCPSTMGVVIALMEMVEAESMRLTDLVVDFIDPKAINDPVPRPQPKKPEDEKAKKAEKNKDGTDKDDDDDDEEEETGPNREEAMERFGRIRKHYKALIKAIEKKGVESSDAEKHQKKLIDELLHIKFVSKQIQALVESVRGMVDSVRQQERIIMNI